ncbi:MAG: hypothetical protein CSA72_02675 [Rhodobacterales bacterium]|nr:MAG: hypothetical protein CSA72_02675 [Rhodobacterales bacterium]
MSRNGLITTLALLVGAIAPPALADLSDPSCPWQLIERYDEQEQKLHILSAGGVNKVTLSSSPAIMLSHRASSKAHYAFLIERHRQTDMLDVDAGWFAPHMKYGQALLLLVTAPSGLASLESARMTIEGGALVDLTQLPLDLHEIELDKYQAPRKGISGSVQFAPAQDLIAPPENAERDALALCIVELFLE